MSKKLTVIIPCYERDSYLHESIQSVYHYIENVELIVLDNNSKNPKIKEVADLFSGIKFIRNTENLGLFGNWNKAVELVNTDYFYILGDDDYIYKGFIECVLEKIHKDGPDLIYTDFQAIDAYGKNISLSFPFVRKRNLTKDDAINFAIRNGFGIPTISLCYKKSLFNDFQFESDYYKFGSNDWILLYDRLPWERASYIDKKLVAYRKHSSGASDNNFVPEICAISLFLLLDKISNKRSTIYYMKKNSKSLFSGYFSQFLNIAYGVFLIPLMLLNLSDVELSFWMMMLAILGLTSVFDFGFSPTIIRVVSYANSGAEKIYKKGYKAIPREGGKPNKKLLTLIYFSSRKIYRFIAFFAFLIIGVGGWFYIREFSSKSSSVDFDVVWFVFLLGLLLNLYFLYINAFLIGLGRVYESNVIAIVNKLSRLVLSILFLLCFKSALSLAVAFTIAVILGRFFSVYMLRKLKHLWCCDNTEVSDLSSVIAAMIPNSWRQGVVVLSGFLINKSTILLVGLFMTAKASASYAISMHVLEVIVTFSQVYFNLHVSQFSTLQVKNEIKKQKILFYKLLSLTFLVYFVLSVFVFTVGSQILIYLGKDILLPNSLLFLVFLFGLLELNTSISGFFISTSNQVPYLIPSLISGMAVLFFTIVFFDFLGPDLLIPILTQGGVQLFYNYWKWPLVVFGYFKKGGYHGGV